MSTLSVTNTFANGNNADASQVNTNFNDVVSYVNANCITKDAALAFANVPSGPTGVDPSANDHLARKQYVDQHDMKAIQLTYTGPATIPATGITLCQTTLADPGYDIDVWGVGSCVVNPVSNLDLNNIWELAIYYYGGTAVQRAGLRIPIVTPQQSLCVPSRITTFTTGSYGGTLSIVLKAFRSGGTQANLTTAATNDSRYFWFDTYYRHH